MSQYVTVGAVAPASKAKAIEIAKLESKIKTLTAQLDRLLASLQPTDPQVKTLLGQINALMKKKNIMEVTPVESFEPKTAANLPGGDVKLPGVGSVPVVAVGAAALLIGFAVLKKMGKV
jgi:hypothetical protein